jgi:hypothetical protein
MDTSPRRGSLLLSFDFTPRRKPLVRTPQGLANKLSELRNTLEEFEDDIAAVVEALKGNPALQDEVFNRTMADGHHFEGKVKSDILQGHAITVTLTRSLEELLHMLVEPEQDR